MVPVISLIGTVGFGFLGFMFPAVADTAISLNTGLGKWNWILWKNICLIIIAIFLIVIGGLVGIRELISEYE